MRMRGWWLVIWLLSLISSACSLPAGGGRLQTLPGDASILAASPTITSAFTPTITIPLTATVTETSTPTHTAIPSQTATATSQSATATPAASLQAVVWLQDPLLPLLTYHQFAADSAQSSTSVKTRLSDFRAQLQRLYESGYSLVSLQDWLAGNMNAPAGRRPLVITMDDLFYNNQILLDSSGQPDPNTGIGLLWQFYQEHPDFGFQLALFAVLGDKLYDKPDDPAWQDSLARTIAWCIDHGAMVYNHFYTHPRLDLTRPLDIEWEAAVNDRYLRKLLTNIGREDLIPRLGNMIALPYDVWPSTDMGKKILLAYKNPEGMPLQAIFEIDFIYRPKFMLPPYAPYFDRFHIPRIVATNGAIDYLAKNQDNFEKAQVCSFNSLDAQRLAEDGYISDQIRRALQDNTCPPGIYVVQGKVYQAQPSGVSMIFPQR